jgi:AraC-like DNA-binding protein
MHYREVRPDARLRPAIRCYWFLHGVMPEPAPERIFPDGCCELIFHCGDRFSEQRDGERIEQTRTLLIGPSTRALIIQPGRTVDVIGVRFHPGGATLLGGAPARELRNCALDARDAGVRLPGSLLVRLAEVRRDGERAALLDQFMLRRLAGSALDHHVLVLQSWIVRSGGAVRTRTLAEATGLSVRQMQRRFQAAAGITPKLLSRLVRLQRALVAASLPDATLAAVAARAGYADQAHFTREFREFAGVPPSVHFRGMHELSDHFVSDPDGEESVP